MLPGECVGIEDRAGSALAVFPEGTTVTDSDGTVVVVMPGGPSIVLGEELIFGGGGWSRGQAEGVVPDDMPPECLTERVIQVGEVLEE